MEKKMFAVMRWLNDGNRLSVHSLKQVVEPKIPLDEFKSGMCGVSLYKGYPGLWKFRILAIGEKKEMNEWLDSRLQWLLVDATDKFCEETRTEKRTPNKREMKSPDLSHESTTPKKRHLESSHDLLLSTQTHYEHKKHEETRTEKSTPKKRELKSPDPSHESTTPKKRQMESSHDLSLSRQSPYEHKKNEGSDSIGIHTSVSHLSKRTGDSFSERIYCLEKTVRRLEDKIKKLSNRCDLLEGKKQVERPSNHTNRIADNEIPPPNNTEKKMVQNMKTATPINNTDKPEDINNEAIEMGVAKCSSDHDIFKYLCACILSQNEIMNCTRTGKKTIKCTDTKPQVNQEKFSRLQDLVLKHTKLDKAAFIKKFENMQKVLRRK